MTLYVYGSETDVMLASDSTVFEITDNSYFDPTFSRAAVRVQGTESYGEVDPGSNLTTYWIHGLYRGNVFAETPLISLLDGSGTESFRLNAVAAGGDILWQSLQMYYLSGASWVAIGSPYVVANSELQELDLKVIPGGSGSAELYVAGTRRASGSASMTSFASLRKAHLRTGGTGRWSQIIVADEPTAGCRVITCPATGVGDNNDGTGAYTDINEAVSNDANFVSLSTNGNVKTFDHSTDFTGYDVLALGVAARIKVGATGLQNVQLVMDSTSNYVSTTKAGNNGYSNVFYSWPTDPNTSAAWTAANATATHYGLKGIT